MKMRKGPTAALMIVAILIALYTLFPFFLVVINSMKKANDIVASPVSLAGASISQLSQNISNVVSNSNFNFWAAFGTSAIITIVSLILLALFGGMAAWVICRNKTKWSTVIYMTFIASMIIPFQVVMLALISTFRDVGNFIGIKMLQSIPGIVFAYLGFGGAMTVFILTGFIKGIPYELEEAAAIDGCSPEGTFFRIIFPLLKPVITTVTILNDLERLPASVPDARTERSGQDPSGCCAGLRRFLCQEMGPDSSCSAAGHPADDHPVYLRTEADYQRYGRRSN